MKTTLISRTSLLGFEDLDGTSSLASLMEAGGLTRTKDPQDKGPSGQRTLGTKDPRDKGPSGQGPSGCGREASSEMSIQCH